MSLNMNLKEIQPWKGSLIVLAVVLLTRLPAFWTPVLDVDESQFAGFAMALLEGGRPYIASLDTKPLGIYWFFAGIFWLFGHYNMIAVHVVTALWVWLTALCCWRCCRLLGSARAGFWAALFYAIFSTTFIPKFIATSILIVLTLPLTASVMFALEWERSQKLRHLFVAGLLWGMACLVKYQAGINLVVMALYLLALRPLTVERSLRGVRVKEFAVFVAGGGLIGAGFAVYLAGIGVWQDFVFWSLRGSAAYIGAAAGHVPFLTNLAVRGGGMVAAALLLWSLALVRCVRMLRSTIHPAAAGARPAPAELLVICWLAFSFVAVSAGGKFYPHYFLQMFPALCILAGLQAAAWLQSAASSPQQLRLRGLILLAGMIIPAAGFFAARLEADRIYAAIGEENPDVYRAIGEHVRLRTQPDERIFVWGFATPIYLFADRPAASRFLWCDWLTGRISGTPSARDPGFDTTAFITPGSWEMLRDDLIINAPAYIVDTSPGNHHDYGKYPVSRFPLLANLLRDHYRLEATINGADLYRRTR